MVRAFGQRFQQAASTMLLIAPIQPRRSGLISPSGQKATRSPTVLPKDRKSLDAIGGDAAGEHDVLA